MIRSELSYLLRIHIQLKRHWYLCGLLLLAVCVGFFSISPAIAQSSDQQSGSTEDQDQNQDQTQSDKDKSEENEIEGQAEKL